MRVALISKACIVGIYQRKLEYIARQNVELLVVVPPSWKDERGEMMLERVYTDGYRMEVLPLNFNGNFHLYYFRGLGALLREFQPDIIHIDEEPYNLAAWQMMFYAKRLHARTVFFSWQNILRTYPPPFRWGEAWILNNTDFAMVGTDEAGDVWRDKGYRGPMMTVPQFGTDAELFIPRSSSVDRPFTVGFIGRLVPEKGLMTLMEALCKLDGEWRLRLVGDGPLRATLERFIHEHHLNERVQFIGQIPSVSMPQQYQEMDVLVLPSLTMPNWKEQFGRVLLEAMASGVPVIGSDSGAIPGVIGDAGLIFPEGDPSALLERIRMIIDREDLRTQFAINGRKRVLENFTHQQIALQTCSVYEEIF